MKFEIPRTTHPNTNIVNLSKHNINQQSQRPKEIFPILLDAMKVDKVKFRKKLLHTPCSNYEQHRVLLILTKL